MTETRPQHTFTGPVAMTPEKHEHFDRAVLAANPGIYIAFSCGRRGAGSVSCQFCGVPLLCDEAWTYPLPDDHEWQPEESALSGDRALAASDCPRHGPGREMGPVYGPFTYAQLTYEWLRVDDGEHLAVWNAHLGDWVICDDGPYAGESYSDATIAHYAEIR